MSASIKHKIEYVRHPNGRDIEIRCACGIKLPAHNPTDALQTAKFHIAQELAKLEEAKSNEPESD